MDYSKSALFDWLLQRRVHEYLDSDGRPVGEGRSAAYASVATQFKSCPYAGSRFHHPHPMNMSALQSVSPHWQHLVAALGWLGQRCQDFYGKPVSSFYDLALVSGTGVFLTDYLALRNQQPLPEKGVPVFLAGLYKVSLGFQQATFLAMMNDHFKTDEAERTLPDARGFYAWLEAEQLLIGEAEVCAGSEMMISKAYEAMKSGGVSEQPAPLLPLEVDWQAFDTFSTQVSNLWRKVILFVIQTQAFRIELEGAGPVLNALLNDSFNRLLAQQSGLAVELARLTLHESGRSLAEWAGVQNGFLSEIGFEPTREPPPSALADSFLAQLAEQLTTCGAESALDPSAREQIRAQLARYSAFEAAALAAFNQHLGEIQQALGYHSADLITPADLAAIYGVTLHDWPGYLRAPHTPQGMERLRFMAGDWDVVAHVMSEDGEWLPTPLPSETFITRAPGGTFHQEIMPVAYGNSISRLFFSWSYDPFRHCYRMVSCDSSTGLMDVLEGDFEPGTDTVVITDVRSGTTVQEKDGSRSWMQLASTKTSEDSFTDIVSESRDGGQHWTPVFRAVHTRKPSPSINGNKS